MARPGPPLYALPPAPVDYLPAGYSIVLCGDPERALQQQRLLPLSRNILCLPALTFAAPASSSASRRSALGPRGNRSSTASTSSEISRPELIDQLKAAVLKLHLDFTKRAQTAREFLTAPRNPLDTDRRFVFFNGGEQHAKALCLKGLRDALGDEEEVEKLWSEIMSGGVDGLMQRRIEEQGKLQLEIDVTIPDSSMSPISPLVRNRASTLTRSSTLQTTDEEEMEEEEEQDEYQVKGEALDKEYVEDEEPEMRRERLDSTYSSGIESIPTPPASAEIRDAEFLYQSKLEKTDTHGTPPVEPFFSTLDQADLEIHLVPEKFGTRRQYLDHLPPEADFGAKRISQQGNWRTRTCRQCFRVDIPADKSALEVQNEVRSLLAKYIPPVNTAETPTQAEFPEAAGWLLDPEVDLFSPLFSSGNEGLPEALCPSLDLIAAVGADGRELKDAQFSEEVDRQASSLAACLSSELEQLGSRGDSDARGVRISLKFLCRTLLHYLPSHPGATLDDIAAGHYLVPAIDAYLKTTPQLRLIVLEFDLRTGSQAVIHLKSLLPRSLLRLIVVGEQTPNIHNHGGRIYVRQSIGKTTLSFSSLPSPIARDRPKPRRFEAARTAALARADIIISPLTDLGSREYSSAIAVVHEGILERRVECGVVGCSTPRMNLERSPQPSLGTFGRATPPPAIRAPNPPDRECESRQTNRESTRSSVRSSVSSAGTRRDVGTPEPQRVVLSFGGAQGKEKRDGDVVLSFRGNSAQSSREESPETLPETTNQGWEGRSYVDFEVESEDEAEILDWKGRFDGGPAGLGVSAGGRSVGRGVRQGAGERKGSKALRLLGIMEG